MKCMVCDEEFNERRRLKDLFRTKTFNVCINCINKYPFNINYNFIPLDNHKLEIVILYDVDKNINYDAFTFEYSQIYKKIVELNINKQIFFYNKVYLSSNFIEDYSYISTLLDNDILILTNVLLM